MRVTVGAPGHIMPPVENIIKNAQRNEAQGFEAVWWPDHLMGIYPQSIWIPELAEVAKYQNNPHIYFDPIPCITAAALNTTKIKLGTAVTEAIRRHPAMLAQTFLTLDHVTKGRVILGIGAGEAENIIPYGLDYGQAASKMEEAIRIIRLLWENDGPVSFEGRFWRLKDAVLGMGPHQEGKYPPIWVAAHGPKMLSTTARLADGWLPMCLKPEEYGEKLAFIRKVAAENGRDLSNFSTALWIYLIVDEDHSECHRMMEHLMVKSCCLLAPHSLYDRLGYKHPLGERYYGLAEFIPTPMGREEVLKAVEKVPFEVVEAFSIHGTPEEVVDEIQQYAQLGLQHIVLWNIGFLADLSKTRSAFEGLAKVVKMLQEEEG